MKYEIPYNMKYFSCKCPLRRLRFLFYQTSLYIVLAIQNDKKESLLYVKFDRPFEQRTENLK